jgi:opacity protein-like surface antigen
MKKRSLFVSVLLGFAIGSLQAGPAVEYKQVAPPPPPLYGTGFYGAIDAGANVFQNFDDRTFHEDEDFLGGRLVDDLKLEANHEVGVFGGIKLGYVFGTGVVRPTIEGDFFYNGFRPGWDATLNTTFTPCRGCQPFTLRPVHGSFDFWTNSGAFMVNFILRLAPGNQRFQPYVGAGVGGYYAETEGVNVEIEGVRGRISKEFLRENAGTNEFADLAWQVIGGADYYWTPKISTFIEYHFLNYTSDTLLAVRTSAQRQQIRELKKEFDLDLKQHLVGIGLRFHF